MKAKIACLHHEDPLSCACAFMMKVNLENIKMAQLNAPVLPETVGYVYVIDAGDRIKIDCSRHPDRRITGIVTQGGLQNVRHFVSSLHEGYMQTESALHLHFAGDRLVGEWFSTGYELAVEKVLELVSEEISNDRISELSRLQNERVERNTNGLFAALGVSRERSAPHKIPRHEVSRWPLFDVTGITPQATVKIYLAGDALLNAWLDARSDPNLDEAIAIINLARQCAREMGELAVSLQERLDEIEQSSPHLAPSSSALIALTCLAEFATKVQLASEGDPEDAAYSISDVAFELIRHDHAEAFMTRAHARNAA